VCNSDINPQNQTYLKTCQGCDLITSNLVTGYKIDHLFHRVITSVRISSVGLLADIRTEMLWRSYVIVCVHLSGHQRQRCMPILARPECKQTWQMAHEGYHKALTERTSGSLASTDATEMQQHIATVMRGGAAHEVRHTGTATQKWEIMSRHKYLQGAPIKNNPLEKILYLRNCSRFFHQIYVVHRGGFRPCIHEIAFKYLA